LQSILRIDPSISAYDAKFQSITVSTSRLILQALQWLILTFDSISMNKELCIVVQRSPATIIEHRGTKLNPPASAE
jgi:hypothetical protein